MNEWIRSEYMSIYYNVLLIVWILGGPDDEEKPFWLPNDKCPLCYNKY